MGRKLKAFAARRVQLRIPSELLSVFDGYTSEQLSEVMSIALRSITPDSKLGAVLPTLVRPVEPITNTVVRLQIEGRRICLLLPEKRDDFRDLALKQGYIWDKQRWSRDISQDADLCDRAAEITHLLLLKGFCVQVEYTEVRDRAISANYEPEHFRLVDASKDRPYEGWFMFKYPRSEDWYDRIMRITAAKYVDGRIRVPPEHFAEVEDFAEQKDFQFTPAALEILENARAMWEAALIVHPQKRKRKPRPENPIANTEVSIPDSLRDDD